MSMIRLATLAAALPMIAHAQVDQGPPNADFEPAFENQTRAPALPPTPVTVETWVEGLENPWGIALMPDGGYLVTERPGRLRLISAEGVLSGPIAGLPRVDARNQGGLLDVALSPDFASDRMVYLTYAKAVERGTVTAAARGVLSADGTELTGVEDIFVQDPPSPVPMHYGSRIVFDGEGIAYITTGEHSREDQRVLAQDLSTTYGKVIRLNPDGSVPGDNPFVGRDGVDSIWSYGHRNIQGAAIGPDGALWTVEHGPAGGDELNRPEAGLNYGWPVISYGINYNGSDVGEGIAVAEGMEQPVYYWDPVIAPGGMIFYQGAAFDWQGDILIGGLIGNAVVRLRIEDGRVVGEERIAEGVGRVRDVEEAPDGSLMILIDAPDPFGAVVRIARPE